MQRRHIEDSQKLAHPANPACDDAWQYFDETAGFILCIASTPITGKTERHGDGRASHLTNLSLKSKPRARLQSLACLWRVRYTG